MWFSLPVGLLVGSAFVIPPTSLPFRTARWAPPGRWQCQIKRTMSVDDDNANDIFSRQDQVEKWIQKVNESNPSIMIKLGEAFRTGSEESWLVLVPKEYQDELAMENADFTKFFGCAKSALREADLTDAEMAKNICLWVRSLLDELSRRTTSSNTGGGAKDDSTEESVTSASPTKASLIDLAKVVRRAQKVLGGMEPDIYYMYLTPRDNNKERKANIDLIYEAIDKDKKWTSVTFLLQRSPEGKTLNANAHVDEQNMVDSEALRVAFVELGLAKKNVEDIVKDLNMAGGVMASESERAENVTTYVPGSLYLDDLVELSGMEGGLDFENSPKKSVALVVAGESGSGKSTFCPYGVKRLVAETEQARDRTGVIYVAIDENTKISLGEDATDDTSVLLRMVCSECLKHFDDKDKKAEKKKKVNKKPNEENEDDVLDEAYEIVSTLSSKLNEKRNEGARKVFDGLVENFFIDQKIKELTLWWEGRKSDLRMDGLVIVVDEVGRSRRLARGLIDIARTIVKDVVPSRAKKCKIVLAGTGLDEVDDKFQVLTEITDPGKAQIVVTQRVNLTSGAFGKVLKNNAIQKEEVLQGTISSVLSENVRMLTEAIVPCMTCEPLTLRYNGPFAGKDLRRDHRIAAGSSTFFMNYAARVFVNENGLKMSTRGDLDRLLESAFLFFVREAIEGLVAYDDGYDNLIGSARKSLLEELKDKEDKIDERIFSYGLANRDEPTSKAMRFLSCFGSAFELIKGDGMGFENAVSVHLSRLSASLGRRHVGTYVVQAAVPNGDRRSDMKVLEKEVSEIRSMFPNAKRDFGKKDWSLTLVRNVTNTGGPDTMELQIDVSGRKLRGYVDIYGYTSLEDGQQDVKIKKAAISLGRSPDDLGLSTWKEEKRYREEAMFVDSCLVEFVELMRKAFGFEIGIRKRVIVIKECASAVRGLRSWKRVLGGGVMVWTLDFLQPTCLFPQLLTSTEKDDGNM